MSSNHTVHFHVYAKYIEKNPAYNLELLSAGLKIQHTSLPKLGHRVGPLDRNVNTWKCLNTVYVYVCVYICKYLCTYKAYMISCEITYCKCITKLGKCI